MPLAPELDEMLYPDIMPYDSGYLQVSDLHTIYWETYGNKDGIPVMCLHGGPGSGISSWHARLFDPAQYLIICFDQRGCGKSTPFAETKENTTPHLIADMEALRTHLGIESFNLFGGSWGSTLALAYADAHSDNVRNMLLYGIFLARDKELMAITDPNGPAAQLFPEYYERFASLVPEDKRHDLSEGYRAAFAHEHRKEREKAIRNWCHWEMRIMDLEIDEAMFNTDEEDMAIMTALSMLEHHYFGNNGFVNGDKILSDIGGKMAGKNLAIVQGRYDLVCPAATAYELHRAVPHSTLTMIPTAGHTAKHPVTMKTLKEQAAKICD